MITCKVRTEKSVHMRACGEVLSVQGEGGEEGALQCGGKGHSINMCLIHAFASKWRPS